MSADLRLIAAPDDAEWRRKYQWLRDAEFLADTHEDFVEDADGYLTHVGDLGATPSRGSTFDQNRDLRRELGLDGDLDGCWIGQVSWAKAGLVGQVDPYVPAPVLRVSDIVGEGRVLTPGLAQALLAAMNLPNRSIYGRRTVMHVPPAEYARYVDAWAQAHPSMRAWMYKPIGHRMLLQRKPDGRGTSGLVRRRRLKQWLAAHHGCWLIAESE